MENQIIVEHRGGGHCDITLNRPHRANALDAATVDLLIETILEAYEDDTRLLVLRSSGKHFCSGFDIGPEGIQDKKGRSRRMVAIETLLQLLWNAPVVTVAMVNGQAIGAGAEIVANCDYRVGGNNASFKFPGFRLSGVTLGTGRLAHVVGQQKAFDLILRGTKLGAQDAQQCNLLSSQLEVSAQEEFIARLAADLEGIAKGSIIALKAALRGPDRWQSISRIPLSLRQ